MKPILRVRSLLVTGPDEFGSIYIYFRVRGANEAVRGTLINGSGTNASGERSGSSRMMALTPDNGPLSRLTARFGSAGCRKATSHSYDSPGRTVMRPTSKVDV